MFVIIPNWGCAILQRYFISPKWFVPSSMTAISCFWFNLNNVSGTPIALFLFPSVFSTLYFFESTCAIKSFVDVLPLLPHTPITGSTNFFRYRQASSPKDLIVSLTRIRHLFLKERLSDAFNFLYHVLLTTAAGLPFLNTLLTKLWPSNLSPFIAKNRSFILQFLESIETPVNLGFSILLSFKTFAPFSFPKSFSLKFISRIFLQFPYHLNDI